MRLVVVSLLLIFSKNVMAADSKSKNILAVGQGVSSPSSTSTVNYSSGYTSESPLGTIYQNQYRLTGEYLATGSAKAYGAEIGYGQGDWGLAAGYQKVDCTNCEGTGAGAVGVNVADIGVGIRFGKNLSAAAILLNPQGSHRFGLVGELNGTGGSGNNVVAYGVGYSYVGEQMTFALDASARAFENSAVNDKRIQVTPGLMLRADKFQFTINDKITLNKDVNNSAQNDKDHDLWFGLGLSGDSWHLAFYSQYVSEFAFAGSLFF
ncbi:MAG: hypothetical protein K2X47_07405 [Bdellovibrionales bacterium]|nr:hypothetical protein [Bdellovibrionales bacterium]